MKKIFETFKPENPIIKKYVNYYYLDIKPDNEINEFQCFPHLNNTISIYKSHTRLGGGEMVFEQTAPPFQIFTPIRTTVLNIKQLGKVERIVIIFHPLGIQQFYKNLDFSEYITDYEFFTQTELRKIFSLYATDLLTSLLDSFLEERFEKFENIILDKSIEYIFRYYEEFSVTELSNELQISRQHLNRLFQQHLGVSVKKLHEIVLFRQTINKKLFEKSNGSFTQLAYEFNFNDQSHFNKTYKNLTANSPKSFFARGTILGKEDTFWHLKP
ncbi:helix-turn-helix domain-containing protein [Elizabethkingia miricola]|uniref:helix-turn-helix domain-containing protein n=1 Tax=Elizabethkingia miricola TaxID=172045 RepID=UPI00099B1FD6|nr:AraC family transcriptional regulator [Elizabethkingia miricola]OPC37035.1 transcriptional regulator [Elizabethkingia miricola]